MILSVRVYKCLIVCIPLFIVYYVIINSYVNIYACILLCTVCIYNYVFK